jgi:[acyl-carrier-protein] S-malonyltransferase
MGRDAHDNYESAAQVFDEVTAATGIDARKLCFETDEDTLRQTQNAQIALFTSSVATFRAIQPKAKGVAMAGHSVGEYAALACAGVISVADGAKLVQKRGDLMARAGTLRPGTMAAVLGLDDNKIEEICAALSSPRKVVVVANYNSPGQVVISGDIDAVADATKLLQDAGAKRCIPLNVSGAFHSPLMHDAARAMGDALGQVAFSKSDPAVISNVTAEPGADWRELLERQLESPVRWTESVRKMIELGADTFVECGPGDVLTGLLRRIDGSAKGISAASAESIRTLREELLT